MGEIFDYCQGLLTDDNLEGIFISQNENNNSRIINNRRRSSMGGGMKNPFIPINSKEENNLSPCISTNNLKSNKNIDIKINEYKKIDNNNNKDVYIGVENELVNSISKMTKIIETLENKNKILEKEKNNIQNENTKLLREIEIYKNTISKLKNKNKIYYSSDKSEIINSTDKNNNNINNKDEQIKIIFLFKNNKKNEENKENKENKENNIINNTREEIMAYKYEMFIEVKLRLLNLKHLDPGDIKACYHNSKEINDWFTLEELNFDNITYVNCEFV